MSPSAVGLLLAAQLWLAGCASVGPRSVPSKRELVSVTFSEPKVVESSSGVEHTLYSLVGSVERVSGDTVFLRVEDTTPARPGSPDDLRGDRVDLLKSDLSDIVVLEEDTSGATIAATMVATFGAFLVGVALAVGYGLSGGDY